MNVLLVVNQPSARNVCVVVRLYNKDHQKRLKSLMEKKQFKVAFDFVSSYAEVEQYLDPQKENILRAPDYTLVEDLIVAQNKIEKLSMV